MIDERAPHLQWHDTYHGFLTGCYCHDCDSQIVGVVPHEKTYNITEVNGKIVETRLAMVTAYPTYCELVIKMNDGTNHVMAACRDCAGTATLDQVKAWWKHDIEGFRVDCHLKGAYFDATLYMGREPVEIVSRGHA